MAARQSDRYGAPAHVGTMLLLLGVVVAGVLASTATAAVIPGEPRYHYFEAPPGVADDAGEPTLGVNTATEQGFSNSNGEILNGGTINYFGGFLTFMLSVTFDDCQSPALATWDQKPLLVAGTPTAAGDPILYTDRETGRTLVSQLNGATPAGSKMDITDDDGDSFLPSEGSGLPSCVDHQTVGGGPFHEGIAAQLYPNAVYYASQCISHATCSLSLDGGFTFGPGVPMWTLTQCGGLHGHIKVGPDGTVYVPNNDCGASQASVIISEDNGMSWDIRPINQGVGVAHSFSDPSVAIATDGTVYLAYQQSNGNPFVAVSTNKGMGWFNINDVGVSQGVEHAVFPAMVAGDGDRAAVAFIGTTSEGPWNIQSFDGDWFLYVAHTFDQGATWTCYNLTPNDPLQRGGICPGTTDICRNLLDFFDADVDAQGRVVIASEDGCIGGCLNGSSWQDNSYTAKAGIARQSGGKRLFAEFDPVEPTIPAAPALTGFENNDTGFLNWGLPDHGGATIAEYKVYHSNDGDPFTLVATVNETNFSMPVDGPTDTFRVTAVNSEGEGPWCREVTVQDGIGLTPCQPPGVLVLNDRLPDGTNDDTGQNTPPDPGVNVRTLQLAEPYLAPDTDEVWFTLQVEPSLTGVIPPNSQWYMVYARKTIGPTGADRRFVSMESDAGGALTFRYGDFGPPLPLDGTPPPPNANTPEPLGTIEEGSYDVNTGLIIIKVPNELLDATPLVAGEDIGGLNVRTYFNRPEPGQRSQNNASDITGDGNHVLVGNASCFVNSRPIASLDAAPVSGDAALTVTFDGSASFDNDPDDGVTLYTFDFGDGSQAVTQSSPIADHTYYIPSPNYFARLKVTDTEGLESVNNAQVIIEVTGEAVSVQPIDELNLPKTFAIEPMAANPVRGKASFRLLLNRDGPVRVQVFDVVGRLVSDLVDESIPAGVHRLEWDALDHSGQLVAPGVYMVRAAAGSDVSVSRITMVQ